LKVYVYIIHNKMPNRYIEFVKDFSEKNNISWNCAVCKIKENNLYKPLNLNFSNKYQLIMREMMMIMEN